MQRGMLSTSSRGTYGAAVPNPEYCIIIIVCYRWRLLFPNYPGPTHNPSFPYLYLCEAKRRACLIISPLFFICVLIFSLDFFSCYDIFYPLPSHPKERCFSLRMVSIKFLLLSCPFRDLFILNVVLYFQKNATDGAPCRYKRLTPTAQSTQECGLFFP